MRTFAIKAKPSLNVQLRYLNDLTFVCRGTFKFSRRILAVIIITRISSIHCFVQKLNRIRLVLRIFGNLIAVETTQLAKFLNICYH